MPNSSPVLRRGALCLAAFACAGGAIAQQPQQVVKPPQAQAWIDLATFSGFGVPMGLAGGAGPGGGNPMAALSGMFGGAGGANHFGQTQAMAPGRWMDVTLYSRASPQLGEAQMNVPAGFLSPALKLVSPKEAPAQLVPPEPGDERVVEPETRERPQGRMLLYWGCGDTVRAGQPQVVDFATATPAELGRVFQSRRATQRGTHSTPGRPLWPNPTDARMVPAQGSLLGENAFTGAGVPEGFRFQWPSNQDLMPPIQLRQRAAGGATELEWQPIAAARGWFVAAMGSRGRNEMVVWTSSEQPDFGMGLVDYQTNAAVDRWLGERVLLPAATTRCTVPKGVFEGEGAMLRMIAYGSEANLAHPPRPTDPKVPWEPVWAAKIRVKSVMMGMLGRDMPDGPARPGARPAAAAELPAPAAPPVAQGAATPPAPASAAEPGLPKLPSVNDVKGLLRGVLGR